MLVSCRIVLLHAPSGAGKTSLIQAAIMPYFQGRGYALYARREPYLSALRVNEPLPDFAVANRYVYSLVLGLVGHLVQSPADLASTSLSDALAEHVVRDWIDRDLITEEGFRAQQRAVPSVRKSDAVLEALQDDRYLIRREVRTGWWELYHDRLIVPVRQNNAAWRRKYLEPWQIDAGKWLRSHEGESDKPVEDIGDAGR
jgi:hypothetical protein